VDVDNLAKCVLDILNGIAFEDDSQVTSLLVNKFIHEMRLNSILIGVTKITELRRGLSTPLVCTQLLILIDLKHPYP
ncbi:MAG: RusA family crossover junction endodeoxyribonuclease, partial [Flavobacterium sp.]